MELDLTASASDILKTKIDLIIRNYHEQCEKALLGYFGSIEAIEAAAKTGRARHEVQGYVWSFVIDKQIMVTIDAGALLTLGWV